VRTSQNKKNNRKLFAI